MIKCPTSVWLSSLLRKILLLLFVNAAVVVFGQDTNYLNNGDYVDAPVEPQAAATQNGGGFQNGGSSWTFDDQYNTGVLNYGYQKSAYYQYTGESIFEDGNSLGGEILQNILWTRLKPMDTKIPAAWGYGAEFLYFSSTSESVYSGNDDVTGSLINMTMFMTSVNVKLFFMDPVKDFLHPYWGVGWGVLFGEFAGKNISGGSVHTPFSGVQTYQVMGVQIKLFERGGLMAEIKNMRASATTSNDPYSQGGGGKVGLTLDGVIIGFTGFYRM